MCHREKKSVQFGESAKESTTFYRVIKRGAGATLIALFPKTGRTHQIRIHMKYLGHPVVSDEFYAGRKTARNDRKWCPRLFLHAYKISFFDPATKKTIRINADLPSDLSKVLSTLKKINN